MKKIMLTLAEIMVVWLAAVPVLYSQTGAKNNYEIFADETPSTKQHRRFSDSVAANDITLQRGAAAVLFKKYGVPDLHGAYLVTKTGNAYVAINM